VLKHFDNGRSLSEKLLEGVNVLADNVASTLGPRGRNVVLQPKGKNPIITKDGVTVAEFIELDDPFANAGVQIIKQAARETNSNAGDGTTTATVLARDIFSGCQKYLATGASPVELQRGIDKGVQLINAQLDKLASPIRSEEDVAHIATISANNDRKIGKLIAKAVDAVGKDGSITVEPAHSTQTSLDLVEGFRFDAGYSASAFITDKRRGAIKYEDAFIFVADCKIEEVKDILPVLEVVAREGRPLIVVASEIEGQALAALIMNTTRGTMKVAAAKAPRYGEERRRILEDLCIATGAQMASRKAGLRLKDVKLEHLGSCKKIEILKNSTTILGGNGEPDKITERIEDLKIEIENTDNLQECKVLQDRIVRLASGVAIIRVGGATEVEMVEKRHRIEDALEAVKAAQKEGIVPGGGMALIQAIMSMAEEEELNIDFENEDQRSGSQCIVDACRAPLRQMASNAGISPDVLEDRVLYAEKHEGFNFRTLEVCNMIEAGIIDPVLVTKTALQNAASAAGTLLTTGHAIIEVG
jgi:chaperonin GroEL